MANAKAVADVKLEAELGALHLSLLLAKEAAPAEIILKGDKQDDRHRPGGMLQPHVIKLRSLVQTISKQWRFMDELFLPSAGSGGTALVNLAPTDIVKQCLDQVDALLTHVRSMWIEDLKSQSQAIEGWCPTGWHLHLDALMETPDSLNVLFKNSGYTKLGPAADTLRKHVQALRKIPRVDLVGPFMPLNDLKDAETVHQHGARLVAVTYAAHQIRNNIVKLPNLAARKRAVEALKAQMVKKGSPNLGASIDAALQQVLDATE